LPSRTRLRAERFQSTLAAHASRACGIRLSPARPFPRLKPLAEGTGRLLSETERILVRGALGMRQGERVSDGDLEALRRMHRGLSELRMRNLIAKEGWSAKGFPGLLDHLRSALPSLKSRLDLREPSRREMMEAVSEARNLSAEQHAFLERLGPDILEDHPRRLSDFLSALDDDERSQLWRHGSFDLFNLAHLLHSIRYGRDLSDRHLGLDDHDRHALRALLPKNQMIINEAELNSIGKELTLKVRDHTSTRSSQEYLPMTELSCDLLSKAPGETAYQALLSIALRHESVKTLLRFLGYPQPQPRVMLLDDKHSYSLPKLADIKSGKPRERNEDSILSALLIEEDGTRIVMDAVLDGVGSSGNGHMASSLVKDALKMALFSGWVRGPEDVRTLLIMADLALMQAQHALKHSPLPKREVHASTTAAIALQKGREFYGINVGDSLWALLDLSTLEVQRSVEHTFSAEIKAASGSSLDPNLDFVTSLIGAAPQRIDINNSPGGFAPIILTPDKVVLVASDGLSNLCFHEVAEAMRLCAGPQEAAVMLAYESRRRASDRSPSADGFPSCGSCSHGSKNDDISVSLRYARGI